MGLRTTCLTVLAAIFLVAWSAKSEDQAGTWSGAFMASVKDAPAFKSGETTYFLKAAETADEATKTLIKEKTGAGEYTLKGTLSKDADGNSWISVESLTQKVAEKATGKAADTTGDPGPPPGSKTGSKKGAKQGGKTGSKKQTP